MGMSGDGIGMTGRRGFLKAIAGASALPLFHGCRLPGFAARARTPNYWCTWATQARTIKAMASSGETLFPGDQGLPGCRDNLDERTVFGPQGWARTLYPESRDALNFLLDDGWDVDYGLNPYQHTAKFGSLELSERRFPSIRGAPAQRLKELVRRVEDLGWAGCGLWVACQCPGESWSRHEPAAVREEDLRRKLGWCGEAGVAYLKVDWGAHDGDVAYRELMSELKRECCPDTMIEHALTWAVPLNGCHADERDGRKRLRVFGGGRCVGDPDYAAGIGAKAPRLLACGDAFRVYDMLSPLFYATGLERATALLGMAERGGGHAVVNVEDVAYLGAALGCGVGAMRAGVWADDPKDATARRRLCGEVVRAVAWQRIAPPFGARSDFPTRCSEATLTDRWTYRESETWFGMIVGETVPQTAPAAVSRGLAALPEARDAGEGVPFVVATRHPNGAVAVGALPRVADRRGFVFPKADVHVPADVAGTAVGAFGSFRTLSFECSRKPFRVIASDLAGGAAARRHDITAACRFADGRIAFSGGLLAKVGSEATDDLSMPGTLVEIDA